MFITALDLTVASAAHPSVCNTPMLCFLSPPLRHPPGPLLHHPLLLFPPLLYQSLLKDLLLSQGTQLDGPPTPSHVGTSRKPSTAALCHFDLPLYLVVSLSPSFFPPPFLVLPLLNSSLISPHLPHYFLPSVDFHSPQARCAVAPRCRPCRFQHLHSPSPRPFYPSAAHCMAGYGNTGAWCPKQINKKKHKSHSEGLTRAGFPADR